VVIQNIRSIIGPNMDSDYFLQSVIIKNYQQYAERKPYNFKKKRKANLQNPIQLRQDRTLLYNRLKI